MLRERVEEGAPHMGWRPAAPVKPQRRPFQGFELSHLVAGTCGPC
jgi:hypothetical protein